MPRPFFAHPMLSPMLVTQAVTVTATVASRITISAIAPTAPNVCDLWWRNDPDGRLFIYYNDGTSSQWVPVNLG